MTKYANKHRRPLEFEVGDDVYVSSENFRLPKTFSRELAAKWLGPYPITTKISPVAYRLQLPAKYTKVHPVFHISLLKPHHGRLPPAEEPVHLDNTSDTEEYKVEQILDSRLVQGRR